LNDISSCQDILADHIGHIPAICQHLWGNKIITSPKKYNSFVKGLNLLGHYIDKKGMHPNPETF
jgi:hypothetical protein